MSETALPEGPRAGDRHTTFTDDPVKEHLLRGLVTVAMELSVTRERVATLEALLVENGVLDQGAADAYEPAGEDAGKRAAEREKLVAAILAPIMESLARPS
ncbi:hypothetical protein Ga0102493_112994 [Erythrobacter litoralis]|jgi:hypothetical protein|uniref:Uncharacterized protein n=1 Tax=Erythrobacter litoralis TaxID=39960 RepID=A0A074MYJ7_9SPHN|nr:hypothetical protein [Erythrobacter litoralis]AOL23991.1 hypothetical protein Ga0102493_112994 [Erythrobacter litoralis]KEO98534.1 hypothetical protein EH32_05325 [Erythrobacter litoralis]MEE4337286.1 hypothetical protein [Erythrobacter sp.]